MTTTAAPQAPTTPMSAMTPMSPSTAIRISSRIPRPAPPTRRSRTAPVAPGRRRAPSAACFRRRRFTVGAVLATLTAAVVVVGPVGESGGGGPASATAGLPAAGPPRQVVARPGDTLWSIAAAHHGEAGFDDYLDALIDLNGGTAIDAGEAVILP